MRVRKATSGGFGESETHAAPTQADGEIRSTAKWMDLATSVPEMRAERVETLRQAIRDGQYVISTDDLVKAIRTELLFQLSETA